MTQAQINRCGLGRLTINTKNGKKSTISIECSRFERATLAHLAVSSNGIDCKVVSYLWNGKKTDL